MRKINNILAYCAVFAFLFASCAKDEPSQMGDTPAGDDFAVLKFNSVLNDLAGRAMQKAHFDQVPNCSDEAPDYAVITFMVNDVEMDPVEVEILFENGKYFTAYSEDLKVATPANGSAIVTLDGFEVYSEGGDLIWIAPRRTQNAPDDQFDGYVENSLPYDIEVFAGTKPYLDVEVLCFDRRMANEYGYVFFDIVPKTIYPLCLFANYCNEDGRHWVANYAIDLYYGPSTSGIQLYNNTQESAMVSTSIVAGEFQADPLCLVVPGPPANMTEDMFNDPYLTLVVYPMDWTASYGDIDNSGIEIQLSWNDVNGLLNSDGTTNEYLHLLLGECEGALSGDGTMNPGEGTNDNDDDNDGIVNSEDICPDTPSGVQVNSEGCPDSDGDGVRDTDDICPDTAIDVPVDGVGCPVEEECTTDIDADGICDDVDGDITCIQASANSAATINLMSSGDPTIGLFEEGIQSATMIYSISTATGNLDVTIGLESGLTANADIAEVFVMISQGSNTTSAGGVRGSYGDVTSLELDLTGFDINADISVEAYVIYCDE